MADETTLNDVQFGNSTGYSELIRIQQICRKTSITDCRSKFWFGHKTWYS